MDQASAKRKRAEQEEQIARSSERRGWLAACTELQEMGRSWEAQGLALPGEFEPIVKRLRGKAPAA